MASDWQLFLQQQGAVLQDGIVQHYTAPSAELTATQHDTVLSDLGQFGVLRASGEEVQTFLQNLLSNDIREVSPARAQFSSLNSPKGRVLATLLIWRDGDDYLLQLPRALCEPIRKKLGMYVLRAKVKISDASDEVVSLGLSGPRAEELLRPLCGELPRQALDVTAAAQASVIRLGENRFQINTTAAQAMNLWSSLARDAQAVGSICWDWLNIRAGIPVVLPQTQEQFVAQMVNLDLIAAVNFKKGCYPGQEIVARMQYLGKLKRRMYLAHIDSSELAQPGDELFSAEMEGQASGMVVNSTPAPGGGCDMLAVVQTASHETQSVHWKSLQGAALQFSALPYPIPQN
ncbi:MAG: folate-binding protein YgfZ [Nitrosomonadales bacterium]|nr:folate-binding protein YgfZ [Nitrosomonadales bacterium]